MNDQDYPIGIVGGGNITTAKSVRHYSSGDIRTVLDLADWCLGTGARIEPLRALWIAPGSDIAELAKSPEFWQTNDPAWHAFTTGPLGADVPATACIRHTDTGKWEREANIYAGLDSWWMLPDLSDSPEWATEENKHRHWLGQISYYERLMGQARMSPANTAIGLLERVNGHSTRVGWMDALSREAMDNTPWPSKHAPGHANRYVSDADYVHVVDKSMAYGASALGNFGRGDPTWFPVLLQSDMPKWRIGIEKETYWGMWCISARHPIDPDLNLGMPSPFNTHGDLPDHEWYYTPQVKLAIQMGYGVELHSAYLWKHTHQTLADWVRRIWDARQATKGQPVEDMIKASFSQSLGILSRRPGPQEKIAWYHQPGWEGWLTAQHYLRQVRKIQQIDASLGGDVFLAVSTDSFAIVSNKADIHDAMPPGWAGPGVIGQYRHVATYGGAQAQTLIEMARNGAGSGKLYKLMNDWDGDADGADDND